MKNALLLSAIFAAALVTPAMAAGTPEIETKTAGEMLFTFIEDPHYSLDSEGLEKWTQCIARDFLAPSILETMEALKNCKKEAFKEAYYDADPHSRDWNRPVTRMPR